MICFLLAIPLLLFLFAAVRDGGAQWLDSHLSDESGKTLVEFFLRYILSVSVKHFYLKYLDSLSVLCVCIDHMRVTKDIEVLFCFVPAD